MARMDKNKTLAASQVFLQQYAFLNFFFFFSKNHFLPLKNKMKA